MNKIVFNHCYKFHHDVKRTYILNSEEPENSEYIDHQWRSKIHPIFAMVLSLLSEPLTENDAIERISYFLDVEEVEAQTLLLKLKNSEESFIIDYDGVTSIFPKNIIIDSANATMSSRVYSPSDFAYSELDLKQERFIKAPLGIVYMVNNTCATDCVYCYADKSTKCSLIPFEKVVDTVKEARSLDIQNFSVVGGEYFLYKQWDKLLDVMIEYGYKPDLISTKVPITLQTILKYKKYNLPIQISLDSLDENKLSTILNVNPSYLEKIRKTITLLDENDIKFQIATVLTRYNNNVDDLEKMYSFLSQFKNLSRWEIRVGFKSLYSKDDFEDIIINKEDVVNIEKWVKAKEESSTMYILWSPNDGKKYFKTEGGSRNFVGARCSANYSHMVILPDGQVTICEQLYWNPRFLIGNIQEESIQQIWNSPKALGLAFPKKEDFSNKSVCKTCKIFDECMAFPNRCIADVLKGYGSENWDYPDPRCIKAPAFINKMT